MFFFLVQYDCPVGLLASWTPFVQDSPLWSDTFIFAHESCFVKLPLQSEKVLRVATSFCCHMPQQRAPLSKDNENFCTHSRSWACICLYPIVVMYSAVVWATIKFVHKLIVALLLNVCSSPPAHSQHIYHVRGIRMLESDCKRTTMITTAACKICALFTKLSNKTPSHFAEETNLRVSCCNLTFEKLSVKLFNWQLKNLKARSWFW